MITRWLLLSLLVLTISKYSQSLQLPHFTTHPKDTSVDDGNSVTLSCVLSSSSYNVTIQWIVNSTQLVSEPHNVSGNSYTIEGFNKESNGAYYCLATSDDWTLRSATAVVRVVMLESPYNEETATITAEENSVVAIDCIPDYTAHPLTDVSIVWNYLIGQKMIVVDLSDDPNNKAVDGGNGTLYLRQLTMNGYYRCTISLSGHNAVPSIIYTTEVVVSGMVDPPDPHIIVKPQDVVAEINDAVSFFCVAVGVSEIIWSYPSNSTAPRVVSDFDVLLVDVSTNDEGVYTCTEDDVGEYSATLRLRDPPVFTESLSSMVTITYGGSHTLTCAASGDNVQLLWYHNGVMVSSDSSIVIDNADLSHGGAYQCFAIGPVQTITTSTLVVIETIPPVFLPNGTLTDVVAFSGGNLTLSCEASGAPEPSYRWLKDGGDADAVFGFDTSTPGLLRIEDIFTNLKGMYTCIAESKIGELIIGTDDTSAMVVVIDPTKFTSNNPTIVKSYIGDPFHLNCTVTHDTDKTSVQLLWTLNGDEITDSTLLTPLGKGSLRLNITNATVSHQGVYQCIAKTIYTNNHSLPVPTVMSAITTVEITDVPIEPVVTLVRVVGPATLEVRWTYKGFPSNLKEYQLETQEVTDTVGVWVNQGSVSKTAATVRNITGLRSYTQHNVRVIVILNSNERVQSPLYGPVRTGEDVPSAAPSSSRINAVTNSTTSITLDWQPPLSSEVNGIITDYTIRYWSNDTRNASEMVVSVGSNATTYTLTNLIPNSAYWIQIAAHTAAGRGPFSEPVLSSTVPTIEGVAEETTDFYNKIWFILLCCVVVLLLIVIVATLMAILRWRNKNKGNMYSVRDTFYTEEMSLTEDVVADYNRRRDRPFGFTESVDGSRPNLHDTQLDFLPPFGQTDTFRGSLRGSLRESFRGSMKGFPPPPEYINPPSFEDTLKARLASGRSASTTLLDKVDQSNFRGSGWSVGHDPKSAFILQNQQDPEVDSVVGKPHFPEPGEETSGESDTSTGFHSQSVTNVESFAQFV